ncbi:MAG: hypothetical protein KF736_01785 [Acidobacteria bacterium]|nr:hypothetical protein [Acidobacteriota bacterium]MCW5948208.1 hypothetical protein [Pyrinomonadaceae bacterium]
MPLRELLAIADEFGLAVESVVIAENEMAFRVLKGANQIFIGTETAVREFLSGYGSDRPGLFEASMYGYKE